MHLWEFFFFSCSSSTSYFTFLKYKISSIIWIMYELFQLTTFTKLQHKRTYDSNMVLTLCHKNTFPAWMRLIIEEFLTREFFFCEMKEQAKSFKLFIVCQMIFLHFFCLFSICFIVEFVRLFVYIIDELCMTSPAVQRCHWGHLLGYFSTRAWSKLGFCWIKYDIVALILNLSKILSSKRLVSQAMPLILSFK